jgi:diguanylate cyclase (GGDEF)-like protein
MLCASLRGERFRTSLIFSAMASRVFKPRVLISIAAAYLCLHALCLVLIVPYSMAASYPFRLLAPWLAFAACCWRARRSGSGAGLSWALIAAGIFLWAIGMALSAWEDLAGYDPAALAYFSDFIFILYGVPILLSVSSPSVGERIPLFLWLDALQVALSGFLVYSMLFTALPFTGQQLEPISTALLVRTYNIENLALASASTLRLIAHARRAGHRRLYVILAAFLWAYALCAAVYNREVIALDGQTGIYDLLVVIPFLLLAVLALLPPSAVPELPRQASDEPLALLIDNAAPILYTLAVLSLGIVNLRTHVELGTASVVIALIVYAIRSLTLQRRLMFAQKALLEARDRLERISLQDGLTDVANRRCFDRTFQAEWNRSIRAQAPLSLLLVDLDHFKRINDEHGHLFGDQCLIAVAKALSAVLPRTGDLLARYGGEEFAAILSATDAAGAQIVAARMRASVGALAIRSEAGADCTPTISIGVSTWKFPEPGLPEDLVEAADRALYRAKQNGRNRTEYLAMKEASPVNLPRA